MKNIQVLSPELINKIAAGEVVERPSSILKELIENSIDAGATKITIEINKSGIELIQISDNGIGMNFENAKMALVQHATSKIYSIKDLENILTLGFRGEALASISSVADTHIHTYDGKSDPLIVKLEDYSPVVQVAKARNRGTTVTVRNLFRDIPARRKFIRSDSTEYKHILNTLTTIAIANPEIQFIFYKDNKLIFDYLPRTLKNRIKQIFPNVGQLISLNYQSDYIKIEGYLGHPINSRHDNTLQFLFVNSRPIHDRLINQAIKEGYSSSLMHGQYPTFFLNIYIKPEDVDINIHPRKLEVRFLSPSKVFGLVKLAVDNTIKKYLKVEFDKKFELNSKNDIKSNSIQKNIDTITSTNLSIRNSNIGKNNSGLTFTKNLLEGLSNSEVFTTQNTSTYKYSNFIQIFNTYIVLEYESKLIIIDQHAADERINYEKIKNSINSDKSKLSERQQLLIKTKLNLTQAEKATFLESKPNLETIGFRFDILDESIYIVEAPTIIKHSEYSRLISQILSDLENNFRTDNSDIWTKKLDHIIATLACHGSIRAGQKLHNQEIQRLLEGLDSCVIPYSCPHGRPLSWEITREQLEKQFKRLL